ncbi:response regulator transcription factor [Kineosporia rhizophila]|uniref:response regulator transcription factor n=1 Tax=Kineosporia TaxID=49184 RepID=UPI000AC7C73B|nr:MULTISPECIES: response regulator transcription factor [Kineosporia]MCE0539990.1 response regulator transcription factor [Kineosporia rhizophila]GLY14406.1 DNA-binding response regulator [Kineosporia sp. NBRC 101677]
MADDSTLFRGGLRLLLSQVGVEVCLEAGNGDELLAGIAEARPEVAILDIRMPPTYTREGLQTAARIREIDPGIGVLILSTYAETTYAAELFANGSSGRGYMLKDRVDDVATLRDALVRLAAGESLVDTTLVDSLIGHSRRQDALAALTVRERQVLRQMAEGRSNAGVASVLNLSHKTVENYAASIFGKLDIPAGSDDNRRVLAVLSWLRAGPGAA